jgi:hypothetical protein
MNGWLSDRTHASGWLFVVASWVATPLCLSACRVDPGALGGATSPAARPADAADRQPIGPGPTGPIAPADASDSSPRIDPVPMPSPTRPEPSVSPTVDAGQPPDLSITGDAPQVPIASLPDAAPPLAEVFCSTDPALLVCLPFDGTATDLSPARRDLLVTGITFEPGHNGQAVRFGPGREVQVRQPFTVAERIISVELAVRPLAYPPPNVRAGLVHSPGQYGVFLLGDNGDLECRTPAGIAIAPRALPLSAWTTILCVFGQSDVQIFVNGEAAASADLSSALVLIGDSGTRVGITDLLGGGTFDGLIDDVRIWRGRRSP